MISVNKNQREWKIKNSSYYKRKNNRIKDNLNPYLGHDICKVDDKLDVSAQYLYDLLQYDPPLAMNILKINDI